MPVSLGYDPDIYLFGISFGQTKEIKCPEGPVYVLEDTTKAFPVFGKDVTVGVDLVKKALDKIELKGGVGVKHSIVRLFDSLDNTHADLGAHYRAAYEEFKIKPCDHSSLERLRDENSKIRQGTFILRSIQFELTRDPPNADTLSKLYNDLKKLFGLDSGSEPKK